MKNKSIKYIFSIIVLQSFALSNVMGQTEAAANPYFYDKMFAWGLGLLAAFVVVAAIAVLFHLLNVMIKVQQIRIYQEEGLDSFLEEVKKPKENMFSRFYERMTSAVPVEKEEDIMFDHEYDGIRELDNSLPPWWVAMFYITIAFAVVYMGYFHFFGEGPGSREEYQIEMERAEEQVQAYRARQANLIDESSVTRLTDEADLALGKTIYDANCAACHGFQGEGGVGPNMTDEYWIHGGSIQDLFKTIKYGVPEKGMISWKSQLRAGDMQKVASYILNMQGTNPPNAKEPQGEIYRATEEASDTTSQSETLGMNN